MLVVTSRHLQTGLLQIESVERSVGLAYGRDVAARPKRVSTLMLHLRPRVIISKRIQELHSAQTKTVHSGLCSVPRTISSIREIYNTVVLLTLPV